MKRGWSAYLSESKGWGITIELKEMLDDRT